MRRSWLAWGVIALAVAAGCAGSSDTQSLSPGPTASPPDATQSPTSRPAVSASGPVATLTLAPTGSARPTTPTAAPSDTAARPTGTPTPGNLVVTDADNGTTVRLHPHDRLEVRLSEDSYDPPTSSQPVVLVRRGSTGGYPSASPVVATFEALGKGTSDVSTTSDYACFHTSPRCLRPTRMWSIQVIVT